MLRSSQLTPWWNGGENHANIQGKMQIKVYYGQQQTLDNNLTENFPKNGIKKQRSKLTDNSEVISKL